MDRLLSRGLDACATIHLVNTDPPYNLRTEPRSNNVIAAALSSFEVTHHQKMDVVRHPEKARPTGTKPRPEDRPLANDFISEADYDRLLHAWFGNLACVLEPDMAFYVWRSYANCGNYPFVLEPQVCTSLRPSFGSKRVPS